MSLAAAALALHLELIRQSLTGTHCRYGEYRDGVRIGELDLECGGSPPFETPQRAALQSKPARVFVANPVKTLNDPNLQDQNNSATAVPDAAYTTVTLDDLNASGPLGGPYAQIVDTQAPNVAPIDVSQSLLLDRSAPGFEDVNAYFQVDRSQKYLQSLGYTDGRALVPYPVPIDTHALGGADDSIFIPTATPGHGELLFGDGGTDDAEDADLVVHEYAHAIHEWISPGAFLGPFASEGRAISEGFADYWGFSASYAVALQSGRDPFCFADWDARCWNDAAGENCGYPPGSNCLRRLDDAKTYADFDRNESPGVEYANGVIWSSALREIFVALTQRYGVDGGKRIADTLAIESLFGAPPSPGFAGTASQMIAADRYLYNGANSDVICAAMAHRGILTDCVTVPRGELTFFQSVGRGVAIPDNDLNGVTLSTFVRDSRPIEHLYVRVDVDHPLRGDLQIVLIAPNGAQFVLQNPSNDRSRDVRATYGRDAVPVDSLDALAGQSAAGEWRLRVADLRLRDVGTLVSWGLEIQFAGDAPASTRPSSATRQTVPVAGHIPFFSTDVRLLNRGTRDTTATLIFTPSGADGHTDFAAVKVDVAAGQVVALNDVVRGYFASEGLGQLEIDGDVIATTRTYTRNAIGTAGEAIAPQASMKAGLLFPLVRNAEFRTNIGFAETDGTGGTITVQNQTYTIAPFSHIQVPLATDASEVTFDSTTSVEAYASVVDNNTGDATLVRAMIPDGATAFAPAINAAGAFGTLWSTVVALRGSGTLTAVDAATGNSVSEVVSGRAVVPAPVNFGIVSSAIPYRSAVIANDGYRQSVQFLVPSSASQDIPYVETSAAFRTNVGLMSDVDSVVRVSVLDAAGNPLSTTTRVVAAMRLDQFAVTSAVTDGRVHIDVVSGRVAAYASVIDNATGDASFVPAQ